MKIGVVRQRYVASGGAERYLNAIIHALAKRGHEVHVFASAWAGQHEGVFHFHRVPRLGGNSLFRAVSFALWSRKVVSKAGCDLVFSMERTLRQDLYRAGDGCHREWLLQRRRYLSTLKAGAVGLNPFHAAMLRLEQRTLSPECTGQIICNSLRGKNEIVWHFGFPEDRIEVIYTGVDLERFRPASQAPDLARKQLLFVGTGFERKGLRFCIEALARLPETYSLKVAGKDRPGSYARLAERLGVGGRVEFCGHNLDAARLYGHAHLLIHPAIYEPFANVCLEALASGVPVVTSRINGASEILRNGENGWVVEEPSDVDGLAHAILEFDRPERLTTARIEARRTAERLPFEAHVTQTLNLMTRMLQRRSQRQTGGSD